MSWTNVNPTNGASSRPKYGSYDEHGSSTLLLLGRDRVQGPNGRLLRRPLAALRLRSTAIIRSLGTRHPAGPAAGFLTFARLRYLVQFGHCLLYGVLQLHVQFTTSRKRNEGHENIVALVVMHIGCTRIYCLGKQQQNRGTSTVHATRLGHYSADRRPGDTARAFGIDFVNRQVNQVFVN